MSSLGFGALVAIFVAAGVATWVAGGYLSRATDVLDDRFNLGEAVGGMLLLGLAGSLPELAITASAALSGHLALATGNLLGGIAMQTLVLVLLDAASGRPRPLSALVANTSPLNQAGLVIGLVTLAIMGGILPESTAIGPVSPMSLAIVVYFMLGMVAINRAPWSRSTGLVRCLRSGGPRTRPRPEVLRARAPTGGRPPGRYSACLCSPRS
jgi:cation:H+ antiporter